MGAVAVRRVMWLCCCTCALGSGVEFLWLSGGRPDGSYARLVAQFYRGNIFRVSGKTEFSWGLNPKSVAFSAFPNRPRVSYWAQPHYVYFCLDPHPSILNKF